MKFIKMVAVLLTMAMMMGVAQAGEVKSGTGIAVASADGTTVYAADSGGQSDQTGALSAFMLVGAVVASPLTIGGSFGALAIAWPAVVGAGAAGLQAAFK